jgi:hypothetical protein
MKDVKMKAKMTVTYRVDEEYANAENSNYMPQMSRWI